MFPLWNFALFSHLIKRKMFISQYSCPAARWKLRAKFKFEIFQWLESTFTRDEIDTFQWRIWTNFITSLSKIIIYDIVQIIKAKYFRKISSECIKIIMIFKKIFHIIYSKTDFYERIVRYFLYIWKIIMLRIVVMPLMFYILYSVANIGMCLCAQYCTEDVARRSKIKFRPLSLEQVSDILYLFFNSFYTTHTLLILVFIHLFYPFCHRFSLVAVRNQSRYNLIEKTYLNYPFTRIFFANLI